MGTKLKQDLTARQRRKIRVRKKIQGSAERPRLSVFRSAKHIYAQIIDDVAGRTLVAISTLDKKLQVAEDGSGKKIDQAKQVGSKIAELCKSRDIVKVVFDRNGYLYHGRVQAVAEAAREAGLKF